MLDTDTGNLCITFDIVSYRFALIQFIRVVYRVISIETPVKYLNIRICQSTYNKLLRIDSGLEKNPNNVYEVSNYSS